MFRNVLAAFVLACASLAQAGDDGLANSNQAYVELKDKVAVSKLPPVKDDEQYRMMEGCVLTVDTILTPGIQTAIRTFGGDNVTIRFTEAPESSGLAVTTLTANSIWSGQQSERSEKVTNVTITLDDTGLAALLGALGKLQAGEVFSQNILIGSKFGVNACTRDGLGSYALSVQAAGWVFDKDVATSVDAVLPGHIALVGLDSPTGDYMRSQALALVGRSAGTPVPEPAAPLLVLLSLLSASTRRRRAA